MFLNRCICISFLIALIPISFSFFQNQPTIQQSIERLCKTVPGCMGVSALHIESNTRIEYNETLRFPMASTYKLPIALHCLSLVDAGKLDLHSTKKVTKYDLRRGCFAFKEKQDVSIKELIQLAIEKSDNAASDMLLKMVGGGTVVTQWLREHEINQMRVDRSTIKMCADYSGIYLVDENRCTPARDVMLRKQMSKNNQTKALKKFYTDERDTTTPRAMADLLGLLYREQLASPPSTHFVFESMLKCKWGTKQIKHLLPKDTKVWHKTGRMDGMLADVGIIELPNKNGHLALALYSNKSIAFEKKRENVMARIAKLLFDHFSRHASPPTVPKAR